MPPKKHYNPFHGVADVLTEMNRISDRGLGRGNNPSGAPEPPRGFADAFSPVTDILVSDDDLIIRCELPAVALEDVHLAFSGGTLSVTGERKPSPEPDSDFYVQERSWGQFRRDIALPDGVKEKDIDANMADGVLEVIVHNCVQASGPKQITIQRRK